MNVDAAWRDTMDLVKSKPFAFPFEGPLSYQHLLDMDVRYSAFPTGKYGKRCRWLGWAQCAVVAAGVATLDQFKEMNKHYKYDPTAAGIVSNLK
jgi:hypothetical protein